MTPLQFLSACHARNTNHLHVRHKRSGVIYQVCSDIVVAQYPGDYVYGYQGSYRRGWGGSPYRWFLLSNMELVNDEET